MGTNSIRGNLDTGDLLSELRLFLLSNFERNQIALILEGDEDWKFFRKLLSGNIVTFHSYKGKIGVVEALESFMDSNVIGIIDRDYDHDAEYLRINRLFLCDYNCLEMMIISSNEVFLSVLSEYSRSAEINERMHLLNELKPISLLRRYNARNNCCINFNGLSFERAYNKHRKELEFSKLMQQLENSNKDYFRLNPDIINTIQEECGSEYSIEDLLLITQGHDFMYLFAAFCKPERGRAKSADTISSSFRCTYRLEDFINTTLCSRLIEYQQNIGIDIVALERFIGHNGLRHTLPHPSYSAPSRADSPHNTSSC